MWFVAKFPRLKRVYHVRLLFSLPCYDFPRRLRLSHTEKSTEGANWRVAHISIRDVSLKYGVPGSTRSKAEGPLDARAFLMTETKNCP